MENMKYAPLINEYTNFATFVAMSLAISPVVFYIILEKLSKDRRPLHLSFISVLMAGAVAVAVGVSFSYLPNQKRNAETAKSNIESRYDVVASNTTKVGGDATATKFEATVICNRDQTVHDVKFLITSDGTPSIVSESVLDVEALKR
jgi:hypothetical protein